MVEMVCIVSLLIRSEANKGSREEKSALGKSVGISWQNLPLTVTRSDEDDGKEEKMDVEV